MYACASLRVDVRVCIINSLDDIKCILKTAYTSECLLQRKTILISTYRILKLLLVIATYTTAVVEVGVSSFDVFHPTDVN